MANKSFPYPVDNVVVRFKHNHKVRDTVVAANKPENPTKVRLACGAIYPLSMLEPVR